MNPSQVELAPGVTAIEEGSADEASVLFHTVGPIGA